VKGTPPDLAEVRQSLRSFARPTKSVSVKHVVSKVAEFYGIDEESIYEKNLQPVQIFLRKNIELYEMICVRHGLMVVGPTGGGKSSNVRVLASALTKLKADSVAGERFEKVRIYHLNPKKKIRKLKKNKTI
jgi:dynein heavy chain